MFTLTAFDRQVLSSMMLEPDNWSLHPEGCVHELLGVFTRRTFRLQLEMPSSRMPSRVYRKLSLRGSILAYREYRRMLVRPITGTNAADPQSAALAGVLSGSHFPTSGSAYGVGAARRMTLPLRNRKK
ncbi:hypothetical protein LPQ06_28470 [Klebsiella pneumoniae]|nr:hypothetical protein [Klebsiella pneumoniae]